MPHPSLEGFTNKPVMPRTIVASYPDVEGDRAKIEPSDGWLSSLRNVIKPHRDPVTAIEVKTGSVVELAIEGGRFPGIMISSGIWECHLELEISGEPFYRPGIAVTDISGNEVYFKYDKRALIGIIEHRHSLSFLFFVDTGEPQRLLLHVAMGGPENGYFRDMRLSVKKIGSR